MKFLFALLMLMAVTVGAADSRITATITFTNTPAATNTITVNANTRTWTNATAGNPSGLILIGADRLISATNFANQVFATPYAGPLVASFTQGSNVVLVGQVNQALAVSFFGTYARVSYATTAVSLRYAVTVPVASEPLASQRTNVASDLALAMSTWSTNAFNQNSIVVSNLMGLTNAQTITGNKYFSGTNFFDHLAATNSYFKTPTLSLASGTITNASVLGSFLTNSWIDRAFFGSVTNGTWTNGIINKALWASFNGPQTNLNAIWMSGGSTFIAQNDGSLTNGYFYTGAFGGQSFFGVVDHGLSSPLYMTFDYLDQGAGLYTWTFRGSLFRSLNTSNYFSGDFGLDGQQSIGGSLTIAGALIPASVSSTTFTGTNTWPGQLSFTSAARTGLANGNNSGIVLGTNVYVRLSGASTVANIAGFAAEPDGSIKIIQITGSVTNNILTESGVEATAANRIVTGTGGTVIMTNSPSMLEIIYDATAARWRILKASN